MCQPGSSTKWIPRRRSFPATMASCCASSSARAFADCCWAMAGMHAEATYRNAAQTRVGVEITLLFYAAGTAPDFDQKKCGPEAEDAFRAALTELLNQITALNRMMSQGLQFRSPRHHSFSVMATRTGCSCSPCRDEHSWARPQPRTTERESGTKPA